MLRLILWCDHRFLTVPFCSYEVVSLVSMMIEFYFCIPCLLEYRLCGNANTGMWPFQECILFSFGKQQNRNNRDREKKHNKQQLKGKSKYSVQTMAQVHMHINNSVANSGDGQTEVEYTFI